MRRSCCSSSRASVDDVSEGGEAKALRRRVLGLGVVIFWLAFGALKGRKGRMGYGLVIDRLRGCGCGCCLYLFPCNFLEP